MRGWLLGAMCAALVVAAPQSARAFKDGHELLEAAESKNRTQGAIFTMYVAGVAHGVQHQVRSLRLFPLFCFGDKITYEDGGDAVRIWLRGNSDDLDFPADSLIVWALMEHFPCETERP